jgi:hypothetical protein
MGFASAEEARSWTVARRSHYPIFLSLCSLRSLRLILRTVGKSPTTECTECSEKHLISTAFVCIAWVGEMPQFGSIPSVAFWGGPEVPYEGCVVRTATARREPRPTDVPLVE